MLDKNEYLYYSTLNKKKQNCLRDAVAHKTETTSSTKTILAYSACE